MSSGADRTYWRLRELIATGTLASGERLREEQLARLCAVSRTPVREALRRLEAETYVVRRDGGTFVRTWTAEDFNEILQVRALLEGLAAENATLRVKPSDIEELHHRNLRLLALAKSGDAIDPVRFRVLNLEFHELICVIGLPSQARLVRRVTEEYIPYSRLTKISAEVVTRTFAEHEQIIDALQRGDSQLARDCMTTHIRLGVQVLMETTAAPNATGLPT